MKITVTFIYILYICGIFSAGQALGAPELIATEGVVASGQSITITGSGFEAKATVAPVLWDTVENQSAYSSLNNGDVIPSGAGYPWGAVENLVMNTTESRTGGKCYKSNGDQTRAALENLSFGSSPSQVYVSWWWRPSVSPMTNNEFHSSKFIRLSRGANLTNQTFSWTQNQNIVWDDPNYVANNWNGYPGIANQWNFHEVWFNNTNKTYTLKVNGQTLRNNASWSAGTFNFDYLWLVGWDAGGVSPLTMTTWIDDVYMDKTLSRVMLCKKNTFADSGGCEMQPATSWSAGEITATVNQGAFGYGDDAYIYVVNADGEANSNGYRVTIARESSLSRRLSLAGRPIKLAESEP